MKERKISIFFSDQKGKAFQWDERDSRFCLFVCLFRTSVRCWKERRKKTWISASPLCWVNRSTDHLLNITKWNEISRTKEEKKSAALKTKPSRENNIFDFPPKSMCTSRAVSECEGYKRTQNNPLPLLFFTNELLTTIQKESEKICFSNDSNAPAAECLKYFPVPIQLWL